MCIRVWEVVDLSYVGHRMGLRYCCDLFELSAVRSVYRYVILTEGAISNVSPKLPKSALSTEAKDPLD